MRRLLLVAMFGVSMTAGSVLADGIPRHPPRVHSLNHGWGPHSSSVVWPSVNPPGWYTNTYNHKWYYPWFAYYNYSHGPYANWMAGGGYAGYAYHGPAGYYHYPNVQPAQPYIGEWAGRVPGDAFDRLNGLMSYPLPLPRELKDEKKIEKN